jgi:hypothetical protein
MVQKLDKDITQIYAGVSGRKEGGRPHRTTRQNMIKSDLCKFWSAGSFISLCTGVGFGGYEFRSWDVSSRATFCGSLILSRSVVTFLNKPKLCIPLMNCNGVSNDSHIEQLLFPYGL